MVLSQRAELRSELVSMMLTESHALICNCGTGSALKENTMAWLVGYDTSEQNLPENGFIAFSALQNPCAIPVWCKV